MKKLLLLLLLSLGFSTTTLALSENPLRNGLIFLGVDCRVMEFLGNDRLVLSRGTRGTRAVEELHELLSSAFPPGMELIVSYLLPGERARILNGEEPSFAEVIQVTTRPNNCQGASYSLFEEVVANEISTLLKAEELLEPAQKAIAEQEAKLSSNPEATEDKTIRVLMPHGPFIKEKNAFASTMIDFKHQTIDGQIIETARLTTTLLVFIYDRILNVAFYSNWLPSSDLALHESEVKAWYEDFYEMNILNPNDKLIEPEEKKTTYEEGMEAYDNQDYQEAYNIWLPLAQQGDDKAQLSITLLNGLGVGINNEKAKYWILKSAEQGNASAQYNLGFKYLGSEYRGYTKDYDKHYYWTKKAADQGHIDAQRSLGESYLSGSVGLLKNRTLAIYWLEKAAEQGHIYSQWRLGSLYLYDENTYEHHDKAFYWTKKAAEAGYADAQTNLGVIYVYGLGTIKSLKKAAYWIAKSYDNSPSERAMKIWNEFELWEYEE